MQQKGTAANTINTKVTLFLLLFEWYCPLQLDLDLLLLSYAFLYNISSCSLHAFWDSVIFRILWCRHCQKMVAIGLPIQEWLPWETWKKQNAHLGKTKCDMAICHPSAPPLHCLCPFLFPKHFRTKHWTLWLSFFIYYECFWGKHC